MSKGAVIIANSTQAVDYLESAKIAAKLVKKNLNLPVALITDHQIESNVFDIVIPYDRGKNNNRRIKDNHSTVFLDWYNLTRTDVYDITPWDRTLLIDADYWVFTKALESHVLSNFDFALAANILNPANAEISHTKLAQTQVNLTWATVMIFNKSILAESIFELAKHVIRNYRAYAALYDFETTPIRNDFAFSIAVHLLKGYGAGNMDIRNYFLTNIDSKIDILKFNGQNPVIGYSRMLESKITYCVQQLPACDIHLMNKSALSKAIQLIGNNV